VAPPEDESLNRRLSAVLHADMFGFSRVMGQSETDAMDAVGTIRDVFARVAPRRGGTFEGNVAGDAFVALFQSAVEAVQAAIDIQSELAEASRGRPRPLLIRIGIHLGEVVRTESGVLGDSINIAARVQAEAEPGGISVSEDLHRAVRNRLALPFRDAGLKKLKNIREPIRVFRIAPAVASRAEATPDFAPIAAMARVFRPRVALAAGALLIALGGAGVAYRLYGQGHHAAVISPTVKHDEPVVLGVMEIHSRGSTPSWMCDFTRDGLNTVLSKFGALRVYSKQKIDFVREKRGLSEIEAAEQLGITKMISGTVSGTDNKLTLEVQVVDIGTGLLEASEDIAGTEQQLVEMQNQVAIRVAKALQVNVSSDEANRILASRTNDTMDSYKLLTEQMGGMGDAESATPHPKSPGAWELVAPAVAWADAGDEAAVRTLLEQYRKALEAKDMQALTALYVSMTDGIRDALSKYFSNADSLKIQFSNLDIMVEGDEALATFTRSDDFKDARSGRDMHLEVRVSSVVAKQDNAWKIRGLKKPS
jgi:adenylate cyclase